MCLMHVAVQTCCSRKWQYCTGRLHLHWQKEGQMWRGVGRRVAVQGHELTSTGVVAVFVCVGMSCDQLL